MIKEINYEVPVIDKGYANKTLYINLETLEAKIEDVTEEMKEKFIGGRGFDLWLTWKYIPKDKKVKWDDPDNVLCIASGPLGGTTNYPGSGKSIVTAISPLTGILVDSNVGGYFGPFLKFAGFDAMAIQGKAEKELVIFIDGDNGKIIIEEAEDLPSETFQIGKILTERYAVDEKDKRNISVVSAGPGAENAYMGCLNFSWFDGKRGYVRYKQAGRGGTGTVFRNKKIKALVVRKSNVNVKSNNPANPEAEKEVAKRHSKEITELDPKQNDMRNIGTIHLIPIMNDFDLLPTKNFKFGSDPQAEKIGKEAYYKRFEKGPDPCWKGCTVGCTHGVSSFECKTGPYKGQKVTVDGPEYETAAGVGSNWYMWDPDHVIEVNFYCDNYGLDTISVGTGMAFCMECYEYGILNKERTGGIDLSWGNFEGAMEVIHQVAKGDGFGKIFGKGIRYMKEYFKKEFNLSEEEAKLLDDIGMESKGLEFSEYMTKESLAQQGGYGLTLKGPQHDEAWLIFLDMVHNFMPTFEQKAEALWWFPMWRTSFGLLGLCKLPWNDIVPEDNKEFAEGKIEKHGMTVPEDLADPAKVPEHVLNYVQYFNSVTGNNIDSREYIKMSERVYNFQRVMNLLFIPEGVTYKELDTIPFRAMGPVTKEEYLSREDKYYLKELKEKVGVDPTNMTVEEKMAAIRKYREERYEKLKKAVYERRGWTENGVPTIEKLKELGMDFPELIELAKKHQ
ncbi:MAG: aldehyde:ferredoxin oxidoreductase [Candidatus Heimdallarchaeum aukensis]|uniref:Aldehyde:ferredoxin oxidoreductase n=1 Tax=Candidatus Heimdallarchaeum aukensis TaxID=2876573 RepID=A0A9Y1FLF0_9ARCH|nr:MAG: aldehyde:ferredoxin oxidoreductase [Candidatus Heimdallarchaeum aukensis]